MQTSTCRRHTCRRHNLIGCSDRTAASNTDFEYAKRACARASSIPTYPVRPQLKDLLHALNNANFNHVLSQASHTLSHEHHTRTFTRSHTYSHEHNTRTFTSITHVLSQASHTYSHKHHTRTLTSITHVLSRASHTYSHEHHPRILTSITHVLSRASHTYSHEHHTHTLTSITRTLTSITCTHVRRPARLQALPIMCAFSWKISYAP